MRAKNEDTKIRIYEYINEYIKNNRVRLIIFKSSLYRFEPYRVFNLDISAFVFVIHSYVAFELIFFAEYRVAILFDVIESAGITLTVFRNAFAE